MDVARILCGLVIVTCLTACGSPEDWFKIRERRKDFVTRGQGGNDVDKPRCPSESDTSLAADRIVERREVSLTRVFQRVVRKGCADQVISDKIETVKSPSEDMRISLQRPDYQGAVRGTVTNRTTCDVSQGANLRLALADIFRRREAPTLRFVVDTSPTLLHLHVLKDQDNYLDYEFSSCRDAAKCESEVIERGTVVLTVKYSESTRTDTLEIRECAESKP